MDSPTAADARSIWLSRARFLRPAEEAQARGLIARPPVVGQFQIDPLPGRPLPFKPVKSAPSLSLSWIRPVLAGVNETAVPPQ